MDPSGFGQTGGKSGGGFDFNGSDQMQWPASVQGGGPSGLDFDSAMGGGPPPAQPPAGGWGMMGGGQSAGFGVEDDEDAIPLLEELEIHPEHIKEKTLEVLNPLRPVNERVVADADLAGPLVFCLVLGFCLLFAGKVHFGYIYSFGLLGCGALWTVLNLMSSTAHDSSHAPIDFGRVLSVFGYCLLPIILIAVLTVFVNMAGMVGGALTLIAVGWSTYSAVRFFEAVTHMREHRWLLAYPSFLLFACFALITVF